MSWNSIVSEQRKTCKLIVARYFAIIFLIAAEKKNYNIHQTIKIYRKLKMK